MYLEKKSGIIFAIDIENKYKIFDILNEIYDLIDAVKLGIIPLIKNTTEIIGEIKDRYNLPIIVDLKLADIPYISRRICEILRDSGADFLIVHAFSGENVLRECSKVLKIFSVIAMTNEESLVNKEYEYLLKISKEYSYGYVLPANKPELIRYVRKHHPEKIIISPGIIKQGAEFGTAIKAGADFEIIGRAIYQSKNPRKFLKNLITTNFI